jgi:dolichol-phosphate mannosyltransferase
MALTDPPGAADPAEPPPLGVPAVAAEAVARRRPTLWRALWRYGLVGGSGVVVNLAVLHLAHIELGFGFTRSSAAATEAAIVWNYLGNELWTFHHRRLAWRRFVKFNIAALAGLVTTVTLATIVKELIHPLAAQAVGIGAGAALNFGLNFLWTWRR